MNNNNQIPERKIGFILIYSRYFQNDAFMAGILTNKTSLFVGNKANVLRNSC